MKKESGFNRENSLSDTREQQLTQQLAEAIRRQDINEVEALEAKGGDINGPMLDGLSMLYAEAQAANIQVAGDCLGLGADANGRGLLTAAYGASPLFGAVRGEDDARAAAMISLLVEHDADASLSVEHADAGVYGDTPIHEAAQRGWVLSGNALAAGGCDLLAENGAGETARDIAVANGHDEFVAMVDERLAAAQPEHIDEFGHDFWANQRTAGVYSQAGSLSRNNEGTTPQV